MNERLKQLRLDRKLSQKDVALAVGLVPTAIANYEAGTREPSIDTLKKLCTFFEVSADYIIGLADY